MTAAGVQNIEPSAYFPPASTSSSPSEAKDTQAAGSQQGKPDDFQSELARQDAGSKETSTETKPAGRPGKSPGKSGKKPEARGEARTEETRTKEARTKDDQSTGAPLPVQVAEQAKQILPLVLALPKSDEDPNPDQQAGVTVQDDKLAQALPQLVLPNQNPAANAVLPATPDSTKDPVSPLPAVLLQSMKPADQSDSSDQQGKPSRNELRLTDATPPEPVATAIEEAKDSGQSGPSALAFAARLAATPQKANESAPGNPSEPPAATSSRTPGRIPVRYAATAQILQNAEELTKDGGASSDRGPQTSRVDMLVPRIENAREAAPSLGPAAPQPAAPTARTERIIEPPAQPPTSPHDIRVRVPDNNGGSTQVRFVESGGEVRVSVRTADEGLAQNLRSHLNDLTQRLADSGLPAEFWKPASQTASPQNNHSQPDHSQANRDGRGSGGQQSGGQDAQQQGKEQRPAWLEEMEASLHGAEV